MNQSISLSKSKELKIIAFNWNSTIQSKNLHQKKMIFLLLKIVSFIKLEKKKGPVCFSE
jgi:hypothetical protein